MNLDHAGNALRLSNISLLLIVAAWSIALAGGSNQLVVDTDEYHYSATLDPNRISPPDLQKLLPLSPYAIESAWKIGAVSIEIGFQQQFGILDKVPLASPLEQCIASEPRYQLCGSRDISDPNFFVNAETNLKTNEGALSAIEQMKVPAELRPVLQHYRDGLVFSNSLQRKRLEYLRTGDFRVLSTSIGAISPLTVCALELEELRQATTIEHRYWLSEYKWHTCMNHAWLQRSPHYPMEAWQNFLRTYGINEQFTIKDID